MSDSLTVSFCQSFGEVFIGWDDLALVLCQHGAHQAALRGGILVLVLFTSFFVFCWLARACWRFRPCGGVWMGTGGGPRIELRGHADLRTWAEDSTAIKVACHSFARGVRGRCRHTPPAHSQLFDPIPNGELSIWLGDPCFPSIRVQHIPKKGAPRLFSMIPLINLPGRSGCQ